MIPPLLPVTALCLALLLTGTAACSRAPEPAANPAAEAPDPLISISGSGTLLPLFRSLCSAYETENPAARLALLPGTSTGGGVEGVRAGVLQVGLCSRPLRPEEESPALAYHLLGHDLIVFAVHPAARVESLDRGALLAIYSGRARQWSAVGGTGGGIIVLDRDEGESIKARLRQEYFGAGFAVTPSATVLVHAEDMAEALRTTPLAVGYAGRGELRALGLPVKVLPPLGRWPRPEEVASGAYALTIPLGVVTAAEPPPEVLRFLQFLVGPGGRAVLDALGCFPAPARSR